MEVGGEFGITHDKAGIVPDPFFHPPLTDRGELKAGD
jgi:hypothetical protein